MSRCSLTITSERQSDRTEGDNGFHRRERSYGKFARSFE